MAFPLELQYAALYHNWGSRWLESKRQKEGPVRVSVQYDTSISYYTMMLCKAILCLIIITYEAISGNYDGKCCSRLSSSYIVLIQVLSWKNTTIIYLWVFEAESHAMNLVELDQIFEAETWRTIESNLPLYLQRRVENSQQSHNLTETSLLYKLWYFAWCLKRRKSRKWG